jgi:hypothetical protein
VLGRPAIINADRQRSLRAKSMELLVYLAVHDGAAPAETMAPRRRDRVYGAYCERDDGPAGCSRRLAAV